MDCAICLNGLFSSEAFRKMNDAGDFEVNLEEPSKCKQFLRRIDNILFDFHEYHFFQKKPYMITPCNHAFHTECLDAWIKQKRECPTCRTPIPSVISHW